MNANNMKDKTVIPKGDYCYTILETPSKENDFVLKINPCIYWRKDTGHDEQENGYCLFIEKGDWDFKSFGLLWDQVKECGINDR